MRQGAPQFRARSAPPARALPVLAGLAVGSLALTCSALAVPPATAALPTSAFPHSAPAAAHPGPHVVLVGAAGLGWSGVSAHTPALAALVAGADRAPSSVAGAVTAVGSLSVRSAQTPTCPVDGWSTLSAGVRATGPPRVGGRCPALPALAALPSDAGAAGGQAPRPVRVVGWAALRSRDSTNPYRAQLGTLGDAAGADGACLTAVGPGAALAGSRSTGTVARYVPDVAALTAAVVAACPLTLVDAGSGAAAADRALARVRSVAPEGTTVLVTTTADAGTGDRAAPALGLVAEVPLPRRDAGSAAGGGLLTSDSTDWPGVAALTDLTPTLLAAAGVPLPSGLSGAVLSTAGGRVPDLAGLRTIAVRARVAGSQVETWFTLAGLAGVALVLALAVRARWPARWPGMADRVVQLAAGMVFCLPVSTRLASLLPWWRVGTAGGRLGGSRTATALWAAQLGSAAVLAVVVVVGAAVLGRHRQRPAIAASAAVVGVLAAVSTLVVVVDVAVGSPLSRLAVIGLLPIDGSRFHGLGNEIVAALDTAVLLGSSIAVGPLVRRGRAVLAGCVLAAAGLCFAAVDGLPGLGDDLGGVPAGVVGAGVSALVVAGSRLRPLRLAAVAAAGVALALAVALADAARGAGRRTHIGDFVVSVLHGTAGPLLRRKAGSVVGPFAGDNGPVALVAVWFGLAVVITLGGYVLRPGASSGLLGQLDRPWPAWRAGLAGAGAAGLVGAALNDSGIIVALVATGTAVAAVAAVLTGSAADRAPGRPAC